MHRSKKPISTIVCTVIGNGKRINSEYTEMEQSSNSDHHTAYFCYNCTYFMKPNHCAIVTDEGQDVNGQTSGIIARHGICAIWEPSEKEIR